MDLSFTFRNLNIDLRYNKIQSIDLHNFQNEEINTLKTVEFTEEKNLTLNIGNNPFQCDCQLLNFLPFIKRKNKTNLKSHINFLIDDLNCKDPSYMENKKIQDLDLKDIQCYWERTNKIDACNDICTCWKFPVEQKILANCSYRDLTEVPNIVGQYNEWPVELNVSGNRKKHLPSLKTESLKNIRLLDLSNNSISFIQTDIFTKTLQVLKLHENNITRISDSVIQNLKNPNISLTNLTLHNNPWKCDCDIVEFVKFTKEGGMIPQKIILRKNGIQRNIKNIIYGLYCDSPEWTRN